MTVIMTPDKEPFFAGTYFPKKTKPNYKRIGMLELIPKIDEIWRSSDRDSLLQESKKITNQLKRIQNLCKASLLFFPYPQASTNRAFEGSQLVAGIGLAVACA